MNAPGFRSFVPLVQSGGLILIPAALISCLMLASLALGTLNPLFDDSMHRTGKGADFFAVYQAGTNLVEGISIYSTDPVRQEVPYYYPYRYHPFVALTIGLAAQLLPPFAAYGVWIIIVEILLIVNAFKTWSLFQDKHHAALAVSLWLVFSPLYLELFMGQFSFLMASLVFWALLAWIQGARTRGDTWWTLSLIVKSNSVLFVPALLREGRWKTVAIGGAVAAAIAIPYFAVVPGTYEQFAQNYSGRMTMSTLLGNQGFAALIGIAILRTSGLWTDDLQVLGQRVPQMDQLMEIPLLLWTLMVLGGTLLITLRSKRNSNPEVYLLWILAYFLFYKHVWEHHYVMLLPVFVLLYYRMISGGLSLSKNVFWWSYAVIALPSLFVFFDQSPVLFDPELSWEAWKSFAFHVPKPLAVLVLFVSLGRELLEPSGLPPIKSQ
ncbi:MAG: glycosyltransferase 87 family protein [Bacteroidota bacterium]